MKLINIYKKIIAWLEINVRIDGFMHILASLIITRLLILASIPTIIAVILVFIVGLVKEFLDEITHEGTSEFRDIKMDIIGIILAVVLY